jgi:hypothetical protein
MKERKNVASVGYGRVAERKRLTPEGVSYRAA